VDADQPLVSILIPVRNASCYVGEAIESVREQTYSNWEIIVVDDGSTDNSVETVLEIMDNRVTVISLCTSHGISEALNIGLQNCSGEFIARLDADDVCYPGRIRAQVDYLESHPEIAVCGSGMVAFRGSKEFKMEAATGDLRLNLLKRNQLYHPTVMFRSSIIPGKYLYSSTAPHAEDYELWTRVAVAEEIANISEPLLRYRIHESQISVRKGHMQAIASQRVRSKYARRLQLDSRISKTQYISVVAASMIGRLVWRGRSILSGIRRFVLRY
jgi:glycosyltransferase involved in cell wall biosynthesis